jgi:hypothetical protein
MGEYLRKERRGTKVGVFCPNISEGKEEVPRLVSSVHCCELVAPI